jgi:hypothetical protein
MTLQLEDKIGLRYAHRTINVAKVNGRETGPLYHQ